MTTALDTRGWLAWTLAASVAVMLARNPLYTLIILLVAQLVATVHRPSGSGLRLPLWRLGIAIVLFSAAFNALFVHSGETVLVTLPAGWPLVGGAITVESLLFGAANGLLLLALLAVFSAFNATVPAHELVWLFPGALRDLGVVVLVAITYVPATLTHFNRVRDAQAIRGHRTRGWRDWQPLAIPLLVGGLERAVGLAEAMVARGYGSTEGTSQPVGLRIGLFVGLVGLLAGWFAGIWAGKWGYWTMGGSAVFVLLLVWRAGRGRPRTRYYARPWRAADTGLVAVSFAALGVVVLPWLPGYATLTYLPYPALTWPPFHPLPGVALALLALPALFLSNRSDHLQ